MMKEKINKFLDWFESKFNFFIDLLAFIGGMFCILFAIFLFVTLLFFPNFLNDIQLQYIFVPGFIGFIGVIIFFALRITRHLTKK